MDNVIVTDNTVTAPKVNLWTVRSTYLTFFGAVTSVAVFSGILTPDEAEKLNTIGPDHVAGIAGSFLILWGYLERVLPEINLFGFKIGNKATNLTNV